MVTKMIELTKEEIELQISIQDHIQLFSQSIQELQQILLQKTEKHGWKLLPVKKSKTKVTVVLAGHLVLSLPWNPMQH